MGWKTKKFEKIKKIKKKKKHRKKPSPIFHRLPLRGSFPGAVCSADRFLDDLSAEPVSQSLLGAVRETL